MKSLIFGFNGDEEKSFEIFKKFFAEQFESENVDRDGGEGRNESDMLFEYGLSRFFNFEEFDKAIKYFDLFLKLNPNQSDVLFFKSLSFAFSGRLKKAIKILDKAIKLNPDNPSYWHNKGAFFAELNFIGKAHKTFDKAISIEPNSDSWLNKGILYYRNENFDNAINCFDEAIRLNPNDIDSIVYKAGIYSELKDYKTADKYFKMAKMIDSEDVTYLAELGKHLINQNEFEKSIQYLDKALEIDDELALGWMYKAMALSGLDKDKESEFCASIAIELDPNVLSVLDGVIIRKINTL